MRRVYILVLVALTVHFSSAQLDLSFIDPFYYLYNLQHSHNFNNIHNNINNNNNNNNNFGLIDDFHQQPLLGCVANGQNLQGTCMAGHECKYSRGVNSGRGNCTYLNNCCTYTKTCNETVRARVVYFQSPANPRSGPSPCTLRLLLLNEDICQIRVDITQLDLETAPPVPPLMTPTCLEYITVSPTPTEDIPRICGTTTNNNFYIHLNRNSLNSGFVDINVLLQQITTTLGSSGTWSMRLTQLECANRKYKKSSVNHKKRNENQAADDFGELAPAGCSQYFTQPTGVVQSFGAEGTAMTSVLTSNYYSACFKRFPNTCGVTYSFPAGTSTAECTDALSNILFPTEIVLTDICADPMMPITVYYPGPYYLGFDTRINGMNGRRVFLNYALISNCPPPTQ